ncbi:MAG: dienelactone hydrolase family protein [Gemmatimonadaceae bacterium]
MRLIVPTTAIVAALGIGYSAGRTNLAPASSSHSTRTDQPTAVAADPHAGHVMEIGGAAMPGFVQSATIPASGTTAPDRIAKSPRHAEWVAIKVNATDSVMAWVVYPERKDKAPVVIAIHENTGINTWTRSVADQLAADGFIGIAPDLTTMKRTGDLKADPAADAGRAAIGLITVDMGDAMIDAVAKYGMALPSAQQKYGIVGFCWGGGRSFSHAVHAPGLGASVVYYGTPPTPEQMVAIKAPVLGLYGGNDARISSTIPATDSAMKKLGKSYEYAIFEGAGHGFLRAQDQTPANEKAAEEAWPKTIAFFRAKLGK